MKKLTIVFATMVICLSLSAISQDITLRFTGATADGYYVQLDSVKVQNISRMWSETVVYPDTVLTFVQTGIAEAQGIATELSAYPNPFNGTTNVAVTLPQSGNVVLQMFNLAGQKVAERIFELQAGNSIFEVRLQKPQMYLLAVTTSQGRSTIKLINRRAGEGDGISFRGNVVEKRQTTQPFQSGDVLKIVGYASRPDLLSESREIQRSLTAGGVFTLLFDTVPEDGFLPEVFSVSANTRVRFSKGNLQYTTVGTHATAEGTAPGTWRFAPNQWDTIGAANSNVSSTYTG